MPELPEVEFARRSLVKWFEGGRLARAEADRKARTFRDANPDDFEAMKGKLVRADRRGKYLMVAFSDGRGFVGHLGMTGKLVRRPSGEVVPHSRARFVLDSGDVIHFRDPRLFGRLEPLRAADLDSHETIRALGRDPLVDGLSVDQLIEAVGDSRQPLKVALMDQGRIAGLGNIHAAEALFRARLHPARLPASLTREEWKRLREGILASIQFALDAQPVGDEIEYVEEPGTENPFLVYGRENGACPECGTTVQSFEQAGRTTWFCPSCQAAPHAAKSRAKTGKGKKPAAKKSRRS